MDNPRVSAVRPDPATLSAFAVVVALLGLNFVAVRFSNAELPPFWGAGTRFLAGSLLLLVVAWVLGVPRLRGRQWATAILFGVLVFGASYGLLYVGLVHVPAGTASVAFATLPLFTLALAVLARIERLRWPGAAGAILVVVGIGLVYHDQVRADVPVASLLAVLAAVVCAAAATVLIKRARRTHPVPLNAVAMAVGAAMLLGLSAWLGEPRVVPQLAATQIAFAWLVASSVGAFVLIVWVVQRWTASASSYANVLAPLVTVVAAAGLAGEPVTPGLLVGGPVVLFGVWVGALWRAPSAALPRDPVVPGAAEEGPPVSDLRAP